MALISLSLLVVLQVLTLRSTYADDVLAPVTLALNQSDIVGPVTFTFNHSESVVQVPVIQSATFSFDLSDSILLQYNSSDERDALLQKVLGVFTATFPTYTDVKIDYSGDVAGAPGSRLVIYRITGNSPSAVDLSAVLASFRSALDASQIAGSATATVVVTKHVVVVDVPIQLTNNYEGTFGVAFDGSVWSLTLVDGHIKRGLNGIFEVINASAFSDSPILHVSGRSYQEAVAINSKFQVFHLQNGSWVQLPFADDISYVSIGFDGQIGAISKNQAYFWSNDTSSWTLSGKVSAKNLDVFNAGRVLLSSVNNDNYVLSGSSSCGSNGWYVENSKCQWAAAGLQEAYCLKRNLA